MGQSTYPSDPSLQVKEQHFRALFQEKELFSANSFANPGLMRIFAAVKHSNYILWQQQSGKFPF